VPAVGDVGKRGNFAVSWSFDFFLSHAVAKPVSLKGLLEAGKCYQLFDIPAIPDCFASGSADD
jgi:hypothetical protein